MECLKGSCHERLIYIIVRLESTEYRDILYIRRMLVKLFPNFSVISYSVSKTPFVFVLQAGEEGTDSRSRLTESSDREGNLNFVARMDEAGIINNSDCSIKLNQLLLLN